MVAYSGTKKQPDVQHILFMGPRWHTKIIHKLSIDHGSSVSSVSNDSFKSLLSSFRSSKCQSQFVDRERNDCKTAPSESSRSQIFFSSISQQASKSGASIGVNCGWYPSLYTNAQKLAQRSKTFFNFFYQSFLSKQPVSRLLTLIESSSPQLALSRCVATGPIRKIAMGGNFRIFNPPISWQSQFGKTDLVLVLFKET